MRSFQKKSNLKRIMESKVFIGFFALVLLLFSLNVFGLWQKMRETSRERQLAEERLQMLEESKATLSEDFKKLSTPEGKEEFIREHYGLAKEKEGLVVIVEDKEDMSANAGAGEKGFFSFFKNLFR